MAERTDHARSSAGSNPVRVRFDRFELDEANARLLRDGTAVALPPTPFAVLCALVRQPGSLLTTNALLDEVWGHQFVTDSVLRTAISELRTALDDDARKPRFIETVSRRGYRFIAAPSAIPAAPGVQPSVSSVAATTRPTSSVARNRFRGFGARGTWRAAANARSSGSPASRASARRRSSNTSSRALATLAVPAANASSTTVPANRIFPFCKPSRSCAEATASRAAAARRRTDLAAAAAVAQHRGRAGSVAT